MLVSFVLNFVDAGLLYSILSKLVSLTLKFVDAGVFFAFSFVDAGVFQV